MNKNFFLFLLVTIYCAMQANIHEEQPIPEKPIVVVIPSYNNSQWYDRNLSSVFEQRYNNYRVIYIDDYSTDNTYQLVMEKVKESELADRIQIIHNISNQGALANIYTAIHTCADEEIIVILDGDDAFKHSGVLTRINKAYQDSDVWLTYGQYMNSSNQKTGTICVAIPNDIIKRNAYREYRWVASHPRTCYAWLFKRIEKKSLMYESKFFPYAGDLAAVFSMLEMAGGRFEFISEVLYVYNNDNTLNVHKISKEKQLKCAQIIRALPRYMPLLPIIYRNKK